MWAGPVEPEVACGCDAGGVVLAVAGAVLLVEVLLLAAGALLAVVPLLLELLVPVTS